MSRFVASGVYDWRDERGNTIVSFIVSPENSQAAHMAVQEMKPKELIEVVSKENKESRTLKQNKLLWALITRISDVTNGSHTQEDRENIYGFLLKKANVLYVDLAAIPEAQESLENQFRAVIKLSRSFTSEKGKTMQGFRCFIGSSQFNTKEMKELIDVALDHAESLGITDSELKSLEDEYMRGRHEE